MSDAGCPSEDELVQLIEGALSADALAAIEEHIDTCEDCAAVVAGLGAAGAPPKPRQVGRYLLDRRIGGGGMGEVWAAWDPKLRREIAVKLVRPDRADDGRERERLLREARALARLTHPNVIAVHDVGETSQGEVFIATELVAGDTLAARGGASADWRAVVRLYAQAARGLAAAHAVGLVHRDVKPANLLVGADGRVRVADFGLAIRAHAPSPYAPTETVSQGGSITETGAVAGTPAYMAPEQRTGEAVDAAADQFALCVALGEAIAGRRPPFAVDRDRLIAFVGERRPREPELDELCGVIARGLALEPADRFPDMTELADALDAIVPPVIAPARPSAATAPAARGPAELPSRTPGSGAPGSGRSSDAAWREAPSTVSPRSGGARVLAIAVAAAAIGAVTVWYVGRDRGSARPDAAQGAASGPPSDEGAVPSEPATTGAPSTEPASVGETTARPSPAAETTPPAPHASAPRVEASSRDAMAGDRRVQGASARASATAAPARTHLTTTPSAGSSTASTTANAPALVAGASAGASPVLAVPGATGTPPATTSARSGPSLDDVQRAIRRRDGNACRATLAALTTPPASDYRVASLRAVCEMVAGNCEGGTQLQRELYRRDGTPESSADIIADLYCPFTNDPAVRLRRLSKQISMSPKLDCDYFLGPARAAADAATTDKERHVVGSILSTIATCFSHRGDCDTAREVLAEAQVFIPQLALNELNAQCR